ncbi:unnamed protein product [Rotaria sordida]|uniref:Uncharacterized protein n=1 Tax=Rotaria sordida TaxID=392033 RepID=A0A819HWU8_9BILA|nr:unnamed protein product [Rotaria sordida]CAF3909115.1 unnamed protein product [Rotaria sordida]
MILTEHSNMNEISSKSSAYRILLIYHIDEDGHYNGSYYDKFFEYTACVDGETLQTLLNECYVTLIEAIEDPNNVPFDMNSIKESVIFDCIQCQSDEEIEKAHSMKQDGATFENINEEIQRMRMHNNDQQ